MPEILIHKKTVCSTERITEASITKTKIIEQTIKVLILDMEESNKDTIKTQYKTIPLTWETFNKQTIIKVKNQQKLEI